MTKNQVSVRLSDELYKKLVQLAEKNGIAKSKVLVNALTTYLNQGVALKEATTDGIEKRLLQIEQRLTALEEISPIATNQAYYTAKSFKPIESLQFEEIETLEVDAQGKTLQCFSQEIKYFVEYLEDNLDLKMIYLPKGRFEMGSFPETLYSQGCEYPQHSVIISAFFLSQCPITQAQWRKIASLPKIKQDLLLNPSYFQGDDRPVEQVSWQEAIEFCQRLSEYSQRLYRLPTEAEWEYACRGGKTTPFAYGETLLGELANYMANRVYLNEPPQTYRQETTFVGTFYPNPFGLYDMHGNVWEWCFDHWHPNYDNAPSSGIAWLSENPANRRILRGGSWDFDPQYCRSASRYAYSPTAAPLNQIGFRVVCEG